MINRIVLVRDHSASMMHISRAAMVDYNSTLESIRTAAANNSQKAFISVVKCGVRAAVLGYCRDIVNVDVNNTIPLTRYDADGNCTPLFYSVKEAIAILKESKDYNDPDVSFLVLATTDGQENVAPHLAESLSLQIKELQATDKWTFVFRVPKGYERNLIAMGIPEGNIFGWEQTKKGVESSSKANELAFTGYFAQRSLGATSSNRFYANLEDVSSKDLRQQLEDISSSVKYLKVLPQEDCLQIRDFVEKKINNKMVKGGAFYQLVKTEDKVQANKRIVIRDKNSGKTFAGAAARQLLALPVVGDVKLSPHNLGQFEVYIQSTSVNRKVIADTNVLYWPDVGVAYKEGKIIMINSVNSMKFDKQAQKRIAKQQEDFYLNVLGATAPQMSIPTVSVKNVVDLRGRPILLNNTVVRASSSQVGILKLQKVTKIENEKVYLDNSNQAIRYPSRLVVLF